MVRPQRNRNWWQKRQLSTFALFLLELKRWIAISNCMSSKKKSTVHYQLNLWYIFSIFFFITNLGIEPLVEASALGWIQSWICHVRCISSCSSTEKISKSLIQPSLCALLLAILFDLSYLISDIFPSAFLSNIWNDTPCKEVSSMGGSIQKKFIKY